MLAGKVPTALLLQPHVWTSATLTVVHRKEEEHPMELLKYIRYKAFIEVPGILVRPDF